jgi:murein hydrolase activator
MVSVAKAWRPLLSGAASLIFMSWWFVFVVAATEIGIAENQELKSLHQEAETIDEQLETAHSELAVIADREKAVLDELEAAEVALNRVRHQVHEAEAGLENIKAQIDQLQNKHVLLEREIVANEAYAAKRLQALYKLNWVGRVQFLATSDSFFDFIQRKSALEIILRQDEALLEKLNQDQNMIETLLEKLNVSKAEQRALESALKNRIQFLDDEQNKRNQLLAEIRGEKKLTAAALAALQSAAEKLDTTIQEFRPREMPAKLETEAGAARSPFSSYKGLLSWPVRGKILSFFGPYRDTRYNVTNFRRGIDIQAERGEPIRAVADGYTIFAKWFKGFGNMMIVDHGDHYYTVYAHLEEFFKVKGDRVEKGEVIATAGDSGSLLGPALHFEVRHRGKPLDPLEWINKG